MCKINPSAYDDWKLNGSWHKCICGADWSDTDGGPCHIECKICGKLTDSMEAVDNLCLDCNFKARKDIALDELFDKVSNCPLMETAKDLYTDDELYNSVVKQVEEDLK